MISPGTVMTEPSLRQLPERVILGIRSGVTPTDKPSVRIFLGTENAQYRAERVFFYAIEQVRDPARVYEIYLMKNLAGFNRQNWRTGFTNYRFAIPDFANRQGRAIYNDVDQIYLTDPSQLFDLDMGDHGYLSVSAQDTSVMLMDCARMAPFWNRETAGRHGKTSLIAGPAAVPGLWGPLDPGWNARDLEYKEGRSRLLHYTALHLQPWQPFPDQYSYHEHPLGELWLRLEHAADAEGYQVFTRQRPSPRFAEAIDLHQQPWAQGMAEPILESSLHTMNELLTRLQVRDLLLCSIGPMALPNNNAGQWEAATLQKFDLTDGTADWPDDHFEGVVAINLLERIPTEDIPWLLTELFRRARRFVYLAVQRNQAGNDGESHGNVFTPAWWRAQVAAVATHYPQVNWHLDFIERKPPDRQAVTAYQAIPARETKPRVWVLTGHRQGDNAQLVNLAEALGWPYEIKPLTFNALYRCPNLLLGASRISLDRHRSDQLTAPWPDVVIAGGRRSVPVARWIRKQSGGRTRLIQVGRPRAPLKLFDLIITTPQYRLPARANVLHITTPLNRFTENQLRDAANEWAAQFKDLPRPFIAVLAGGNSWPQVFDPATAARLGHEASRRCHDSGGSLLITTSPRTPADAADALFTAISGPAYCHRWRADQKKNPYTALLALADAFIVTGDSASMVAEVCATGKPVTIFELPRRSTWRWSNGLLRRWSGWRRHQVTYRGTPKQQDMLNRLYDRLVVMGFITPPRDMGVFHHMLHSRGLLRESSDSPAQNRTLDDLDRAVKAVRWLFTSGRQVR